MDKLGGGDGLLQAWNVETLRGVERSLQGGVPRASGSQRFLLDGWPRGRPGSNGMGVRTVGEPSLGRESEAGNASWAPGAPVLRKVTKSHIVDEIFHVYLPSQSRDT